MIGGSLRARLLLGATAAIFLALAASWLVMSYLFERHVQRSLEATLILHGRELVAGLSRAPSGDLVLARAAVDPRFETPASGLYWQISDGAHMIRSRSLWDMALALPEGVDAEMWRVGDSAGPFESKVVFVARRVSLGRRDPPIIIMLGADHAAVTTARAQFSRDLALFLALLWIVLSAAAWLQVGLGLKPMDDVRRALDDMRGEPTVRLSTTDYPSELAPLASAINALVDARVSDLEAARQRAGDLAHSLKTPLSAIAAQSRRAREAGAGDAADGLDRAVEAARDAVDRELTRARAAFAQGLRAEDGRAVVDKLIHVVERTDEGRRLAFENLLALAPLPASEELLLEMLGPLIENAARYATHRVRISGGRTHVLIEDDGPGLDPAQATLAIERGRRLDEAGDGAGLGLAIARELAAASGAMLHLCASELGGLRVEVRWMSLA